MAMVRPLATNPAQKLCFLSFTSAEGKGAPLPFWGPSQSFGFSLFPLPVSGDLRLLSANTWSSLCDPHSFLNGHFFWRLDTVNSNTSSSNFISLLPVGYHVTIEKYSLNLLDRHFKLFFNENTVKISYSCTNNMYGILNHHNRRLLDELNRNNGGSGERFCKCWRKRECPLGGRCNSKNVVYQACTLLMEHNNGGESLYRYLRWELEKRLYNQTLSLQSTT